MVYNMKTKRLHIIPITGTVISSSPYAQGDPNDPISVIAILDKCPFDKSWSYTCANPNLETETMEITLDADEKVHQWLEAEIKSVPKVHDLIAKHRFKPLKRMDKEKV